MNRPAAPHAWSCRLLTLGLVVTLCGCNLAPDPEALLPDPVPPEKVARIEPLRLTPSAEPNATPEPNTPPPATLELSLAECRAQGLDNNLDLRASLLTPTLAAERIHEERARFETVLTANPNYRKYDVPSNDTLDQISGARGNEINGSLALTQPLPTGGSVTASLDDTRSKSDRPGSTFNPSYRSGLNFSISQPLLRDAGRAVGTYALSLSVTNERVARVQTKLQVMGVLTAIDRAYWQLYAAYRELEVRRAQYDLAQAQLEQVRRLVDHGQRAPVERVRAEAGVADRLEAIIVAENNLATYERELKRLMNRRSLAVDSPTRLIPKTHPAPLRYDLDRGALLAAALDNRMELLELEYRLIQDQLGIRYAKHQRLPRLNLSYSFGRRGLGENRGDAYSLLTEENFANHNLGFNIEIPLGNEAARSRWRQAVTQRQQRLATRASRRDLIKGEVLNAADGLEAAWQRILATRQSTVLNGRLYEAEKRQFDLGVRTSTDVLDAQARLADAQSAEIRALVTYQLALDDLATATGTLLGAADVEWEPAAVPPIG